MQFGYVLCDPKRSKILVLKRWCVEYKSDTTENINKGFLCDISTMKVLYKALKEKT